MKSGGVDVVWTMVLLIVITACACAAMSRSCEPPVLGDVPAHRT